MPYTRAASRQRGLIIGTLVCSFISASRCGCENMVRHHFSTRARSDMFADANVLLLSGVFLRFLDVGVIEGRLALPPTAIGSGGSASSCSRHLGLIVSTPTTRFWKSKPTTSFRACLSLPTSRRASSAGTHLLFVSNTYDLSEAYACNWVPGTPAVSLCSSSMATASCRTRTGSSRWQTRASSCSRTASQRQASSGWSTFSHLVRHVPRFSLALH